MYKAKVISSSSTANSYVVELPDGQFVAVECGVHPSKVIEKIGKIPRNYWISHAHSDHNRYEREFKKISSRFNGFNEFSLEHGTMKSPIECRGFFHDTGSERLLFATDFYDFEKVDTHKAMSGIAMVECSHDFPTYKKLTSGSDMDRLKARQWDNHACEVQTVGLLQHFFDKNFNGEIILLHRSTNAYSSIGYSELYVRHYFPMASVKWALFEEESRKIQRL